MSDFLDALLSRSTGVDPGLAPRPRSRFESQPPSDAAGPPFDAPELDTRERDAPAFDTHAFDAAASGTRAEPGPLEAPASEHAERSAPSAAGRRRESDPLSTRRSIGRTSVARDTGLRSPPGPADAGGEPPIAVPSVNPAGPPHAPARPVDGRRADRGVDFPGDSGARSIAATVVPSRDGSTFSADAAPRRAPSADDAAGAPPSMRPRMTRPTDEDRRSAAPPPPPTVTVTIGRIDVRAPARARREPPRAAVRPAVQSLDEYLRRRRGGS